MPLDLKDNDELPQEESPVPQPIIHNPADGTQRTRRIIFALFIAAVLGSAAFLVYIFMPKDSMRQHEENQRTDSVTTRDSISQPQVLSVAQEKPPIAAQPDARFTVYIASHPDRSLAQEEVDRWNAAGFSAMVIQADAHYRVALGRYNALGDARVAADSLKEAFEYGYWIGPIQ